MGLDKTGTTLTTSTSKMWRCICWIGCLVTVSISGVGCGYRFAGSGGFPANIQSVCVPVFRNQTAQTGAENTFTSNLLYEISRRGGVVLSSPDNATATIIGAVSSIRTTTVSHKETNVSAERRVYVVLNVQLIDASGAVIWGGNIKDSEVYAVATDKLQTEENKKAALSRLSEEMAETIYNRITANF